jgi:hypothetical protein
MRQRRLGEIAIARIVEREEPAFVASSLLPDATPENLAPYRHWLEPNALDPATGLLILPIQSYVGITTSLSLAAWARTRPAAGRGAGTR